MQSVDAVGPSGSSTQPQTAQQPLAPPSAKGKERAYQEAWNAATKSLYRDFDHAMEHSKGTRCTLTVRSRPPARTRRKRDPDCALDCTFDFRAHLSELAKLSTFEPPTQRYRIKAFEGQYRLQADFPMEMARKHMQNLHKAPVELVQVYTDETQKWEENRVTFRNIIRTPPSQMHTLRPPMETIRLIHRADFYQRPFLKAENALQRYFTPIYNLLSAAPQKWRDGMIQEKWQRDIKRVWTNVSSGELFDRVGKALVNGPGMILSNLVERTRERAEEKKS